jgi:hypothetical protein
MKCDNLVFSEFEWQSLRETLGPKRDEVTGTWRKLHNEERHVLYSSQISSGRSSQGG